MQVYLTYSRHDGEPAAELLAQRLRSGGFDVIWNITIPVTEPSWADTIINTIDNADLIIILVTPQLTDHRSRIQKNEAAFAHSLNKPILPVIVHPDASLPFYLLNLNAVDASVDFETQGIEKVIHHLKTVPIGTETSDTEEQATTIAQDVTGEARNRILSNDSTARVFIAYSRKQRSIAKELSEMLIRNGKAVFWDAKIKAGAIWRQTVQKALDAATHIIVIWTPDAALSDEVEREVSYALSERKVIVPILSKEIPKLPYHLHGLHYIILHDDVGTIEANLIEAIERHEVEDDLFS